VLHSGSVALYSQMLGYSVNEVVNAAILRRFSLLREIELHLIYDSQVVLSDEDHLRSYSEVTIDGITTGVLTYLREHCLKRCTGMQMDVDLNAQSQLFPTKIMYAASPGRHNSKE